MDVRRQRGDDAGQRGQGLVEFALVIPIFMLLLMGPIEYGFLYNNILTVQYASRQGVSVAAEAGALDGADCYVLKAVEAALQSPTDRTSVQAVDVFESDTNGDAIPGRVNHVRPLRRAGVPGVRPALYAGGRGRLPADSIARRLAVGRPGPRRGAHRLHLLRDHADRRGASWAVSDGSTLRMEPKQ